MRPSRMSMLSLAPRALRLQGFRPCPPRLFAQPGWICSGCQSKSASMRRWNSSGSSVEKTEEKPFYITTPIFYVNAAPHIGHLYTMVLADVLKRWEQLKGKQVFLSTGTDEHGAKIQRAAIKHQMDPQVFCDTNSAKFRELAWAADISHNFFIRTTDQEHRDAVAQFWLQLKHSIPEQLGLYKGAHEGWYCVSDECFYPENMVRPDIIPRTGRKIMVNVETENEVEWIKEETWFFPLTKYKDALLKLYDENPDWIKPAHRMNEVREWVKNNLEDLSITRPAARLGWGIPDPEDPSHTIYVWVDALINYLTKAGYGKQWTSPKEDMGIWPADVHVIGKDIVRFHAVYWPALLMSLGFPVAKSILCHNHWTMSDRKMSKSRGNVVNPFFALQRWGVDPLRYFLMRNASLHKDMGYSNQQIGAMYSKELQANIGNLFYRIVKPKATTRWSLEEAVEYYRLGKFDGYNKSYEPKDSEGQYFILEPTLAHATQAFSDNMNAYNTSGALREIFILLQQTNRYISDTEPWNMAKAEPTPNGRLLLNWVIFNSAEALRIAGILLQPIMPTKASELLDCLVVSPDRRTLEFARKGADPDYGLGTKVEDDAPPQRTKKWDSLFPPTVDAKENDEVLREMMKSAFSDKTRNKMNQMVELLAMEARLGEEGVRKFLEEQHAAKKEAESQDEQKNDGIPMGS